MEKVAGAVEVRGVVSSMHFHTSPQASLDELPRRASNDPGDFELALLNAYYMRMNI